MFIRYGLLSCCWHCSPNQAGLSSDVNVCKKHFFVTCMADIGNCSVLCITHGVCYIFDIDSDCLKVVIREGGNLIAAIVAVL